jgi:Fe-S cluster assembly iron-binding protein IscA
MITVSDTAKEKIQEALKDKGENPAVRVYVAGIG